MQHLLCPKCGIRRLFVKNAGGGQCNILVTDNYDIIPFNPEDSLDGFDLDTIFCLGCSWSGSIKKLKKRA